MERVSTNLTLFLKLFIPTFWTVFFGAFTAAIWLTDTRNLGALPEIPLKYGSILFLLIGVTILYFTFFQLKRVEMDPDFIYATDYIKHFRYPYHNIEKIEELDYVVFNLVRIHLKTPGYFGKKIVFIPSQRRFQNFLNNHPEVTKNLVTKSTSEG